MAVFLFIIFSVISLFFSAWLLKVAVKIVGEEIDSRCSLIVVFGMMAAQILVGLLLGQLLASIAGIAAMMILLKKLSTVEDVFPTGILISIVFNILYSLVKIACAVLVAAML